MARAFRQLQQAPAADEAPEPPADETKLHLVPAPAAGRELLFDGPLHAPWFITYELERELERARRHARPLSVVVLTPVPSLGDEPSPDALAACAEAASATSRVTDLLGWLPGNRILAILPETDKDGAAAAIYRLSTEMASRTLALGQLRWIATAKVDGFDYTTADELVAAVTAHIIR